ncbi:MAG: HEAT repeat domain-containing protein [Pseudomonadota bacterium]
MDLKILENMPPWEWPQGTDKMLLGILRDDQRDESDRLLAAELAGDYTIINDELADALLSIVLSGEESEDLRARAVISLGPALETAYMDEFEDPEDVLISEETFHRIQETLGELYMDTDVPKEVRRRILEGAVQAPQDWHQEAIRDAYSSDDESWRLTAVFGMRYIRGFNTQILEALENEDIHYEAVCAAGNWEVDAAWSHIADLATTASTDKLLRLAAIEAVTSIRPHEAAEILIELTQSDDEDIVDAAYEAMAMSGWFPDEDYDDDDEDEKVFH